MFLDFLQCSCDGDCLSGVPNLCGVPRNTVIACIFKLHKKPTEIEIGLVGGHVTFYA